jgi:integrin beta 3
MPGAATGSATVRGTGTVPQHEPADGSAATGGTRVPLSEDLPAPGATGPAADGWTEQLRARRRLRLVALVSLTLVVLVLVPLFFGVRAASRDPVFRSLDALDVPAWAATKVDDKSSGSQWCFFDCRFRERTAQSERPFEETTQEYVAALTEAGWQPWKVAACPEQPITDGRYSCWRRDEFTLDLWVRLPQCAVDAVAAQDPATLPSPGPDGEVPPAPDPAKCVGSTVSIKVQNAVTDARGEPQRAPDPSQVGETPDPVLSNDPLLEPTPSSS